MAGASGGGSSGGGGGGGNKVAALLLGTGAAAVIIFATIFGPWGPGKDDAEPPPAPTSVPVASGPTLAPTSPPATPPRGQSAPAAPSSRQPGPDEAVLTLITYGLPGRFSPTREGNEAIGGEFRDGQACIPDVQFPHPCTIDYIVKKGTNVTIHAGDSKAGFWPVLHSVRGPGCNLDYDISGRDRECTVTLVGDMTFEAKYKGDDGAEFIYPACPHRVSNPPAWLKC